jgi:hypothetical protein
MARAILIAGVLTLCGVQLTPAPACSLCTSITKKETLGKELDGARLVVFRIRG